MENLGVDKKVSIWYFVAFVVLFIGANKIIENRNDKKFKQRIDTLEIERSKLRKQLKEYLYTIDSLNVVKTRLELKIDSINAKVDSIKDERVKIPVIVDSMPVIELDSILSGYVHPSGN